MFLPNAAISDFFEKNKFLIFFLFALALVPRLVVSVVFSDQVLLGDEIDYNQLAVRILQGQPYHSDCPFGFTDARPPLYPLFIAVIYFLTNHSILAVKLMQAVIGALTCIIVFSISENIFKSRRISFGVGLICAFYPLFISLGNLLITETLYAFLLALAITFLLKYHDRPNLRNKFLSGLFLGLAALTKSITLVFMPFLILWLIFFSPKSLLSGLKSAAVIILFTILTILPWTIRNYVVFKEFVPMSTNGGLIFCIFNNENMITKAFDPEITCQTMALSEEQKKEISLLPEPARDRYFYGLGWKFVLAHPKEFLKLRLISLGKFWHLWPLAPAEYKEYYLKEGALRTPLLDKLVDTYFLYFIKILYHLPYNILFIGMLLSPVSSFKKRFEFGKSILLILLLATMCLSYSVYVIGGDRYRMPIDPYVFLLGLHGVVSFLRNKTRNLQSLFFFSRRI